MLKLPYWPATLFCTWKVAALSTSLMVRVPPVVSGASDSVRATAALLSTAASLLPLMVTVTLVVVPSAPVTTKVSVSESSVFSSLKAELATKVQLPAASMLKLP
ncbi:hypothetical protein D9M70_533240 [compost metagenome]